MSLLELLYPKVELLLVTVRTSEQGIALEKGKFSSEYVNSTATIFLNKQDFKKLGIKEGELVEVSSSHGSTIVKAYVSDETVPGMAFMPCGYWSNALTNLGETSPIPIYKGVKIWIKKAKEADKIEDFML